MDIYVNPGLHDLDFSSNVFRYTQSLPELVRQKLAIVLQAFKGEWFANINFGVPYLESQSVARGILGKTSKAFFDAEIKKAIMTVEGVERIVEYNSTHNMQERKLSILFSVSVSTGEIVTVEEQL